MAGTLSFLGESADLGLGNVQASALVFLIAYLVVDGLEVDLLELVGGATWVAGGSPATQGECFAGTDSFLVQFDWLDLVGELDWAGNLHKGNIVLDVIGIVSWVEDGSGGFVHNSTTAERVSSSNDGQGTRNTTRKNNVLIYKL